MKKRMISALLLLALLPTMALADNTAEAGTAAKLQELLQKKRIVHHTDRRHYARRK